MTNQLEKIIESKNEIPQITNFSDIPTINNDYQQDIFLNAQKYLDGNLDIEPCSDIYKNIGIKHISKIDIQEKE